MAMIDSAFNPAIRWIEFDEGSLQDVEIVDGEIEILLKNDRMIQVCSDYITSSRTSPRATPPSFKK